MNTIMLDEKVTYSVYTNWVGRLGIDAFDFKDHDDAYAIYTENIADSNCIWCILVRYFEGPKALKRRMP